MTDHFLVLIISVAIKLETFTNCLKIKLIFEHGNEYFLLNPCRIIIFKEYEKSYNISDFKGVPFNQVQYTS